MAMTNFQEHSKQTAKKTAFIDIEASGLSIRSWPVEVGWVFLEGPPRSLLVAPEAQWSDDAWDPRAEGLHGISRDRLRKEGEPAADVCSALNSALADCLVYSDAPEWDSFWLYRLFNAAGKRTEFDVLDFADVVRPLIAGREDDVIQAANDAAPRTHRAAQDALHLRTLHRLASGS